jgi:hypothetical protein
MVVELSVNVSTDLRQLESLTQGCIASIICGAARDKRRHPTSLGAFQVLCINTDLHFRFLVVRKAFYEDVSAVRPS